jgi:hypothetical protein
MSNEQFSKLTVVFLSFRNAISSSSILSSQPLLSGYLNMYLRFGKSKSGCISHIPGIGVSCIHCHRAISAVIPGPIPNQQKFLYFCNSSSTIISRISLNQSFALIT